MELKDLVGSHKLSGVDEETESVKETWGDGFEDCQVIRFTIDGITYSAIEDPDDGYRSSMRDVKVSETPIKNTFKPQEVMCKYLEENGHKSTCDILEISDIKNGETILLVGTDNTDDYYPSFVASWIPEKMSINENKT